MQCPRCKSLNPDGNKFCSECGSPLVPDLGTLAELLNSTMRQEIQATLRDQLKDREYLELSIAKSIEERMELWGKRLTYFLGIPVALMIIGFSLFGIRSIKDFARDLTADVKKNASDAVSEANQVKNEAKKTEDQLTNVQKEVSTLQSSTTAARTEIEKNKALFNQAAKDLQPEVDRAKKLAQEIDTLHRQVDSVQDAVASATALSDCPPWGSAEKESAQGLLNQLKRRLPSESTPKALSFEDFRSLQAEADSAVGQGLQLDLNARQELRNLKYSGGMVSEGDLVQLAGYVLVARIEASESVNCGLRGPTNNDIHIALVNKPHDTEFDAIVAEAIPQARPTSWNAQAINQVGAQKHRVLIVGQLLYDNAHKINSDPNNRLPQPRRFSLWEIHPITHFLVCLKTAECEVTHEEQWTPLEKVQ